MSWYRVTVNGVGIYEAVDRDCPRDDIRRQNKPDGGWLPKVGARYPGAISYWTEFGWKTYNGSGLFAWHTSVVMGEVSVEILDEKPQQVLYEDEYQMIVPKCGSGDTESAPSDIALYTNQTNEYDELQHLRPDYREAERVSIDLVAKYSASAAINVVDFCGGSGSFMQKLAERIRIDDSLIVDINKCFLDLAKDRMRGIAEVRTLCSDIIVAEINNQFDWVLSIFAYHHVPDDKKIQYLQKAFNALKHGGRMILTEIYLPDRASALAYYEKVLSEIPLHQRRKSLEVFLRQTAQSTQCEFKVQKSFMEAQIKEVGFRVIEEQKIWPLNDSFSVDVGTFVTILQKTH